MTKRTPILLACLALAAGGLAACGDDDEGDTAATATATTARPAAGGEVVVDMKDIKYVPRDVTAKVGQTVRWTNGDPVAHTVTARSGSDVDSGTIAPGKEFETRFTRAGRVDYLCRLHPDQTGSVTVVR